MKFPALLTLAFALPVMGAEVQQILESGSFEWPPVTERRSLAKGADISKSAMNAEWVTFKDKPDADGGELKFGLTNEQFRTGRQCMFVEFNKLTKPRVVAELASDYISILPGKPYHVAIWGRMDRKRPITLAQRVPYLKLRVDWYKIDEEEEKAQTGDSVWKVQPIPGPPKRPPLFVSSRWSPYFADVTAPEDATFMKITWYLESAPEAGETDGVIYFDDAVLEGEPGPKVDPLDEIEMEEAEKEKAAAAAAGTLPGEAPKAEGAKDEPGKAKAPEAKPAESKPAAPGAEGDKTPAKKELNLDVTPVR